MTEIDFTRVLPSDLEMTVGAGGALMLTVVLVIAIIFMKRWKGRIVPMLLGLVAYLILVFIPTNLLLSALALIPSVATAFEYNQEAYSILYCGLAAVTGIIAKIVLNKMLAERYERQGDIYMSGLGIGLGDGILYGMTAITTYIWCIAINSDGLESLLQGISQEEALAMYESIDMMYVAPAALWLIFGVNAVLDIVMQIILTNVTYGVVKGQLPTKWYGVSMGITFAMLITFQLYDMTSLTNILIWFAVKIIIFAAAVYYMHFVVAKEIKYIEE